jgi:CubicO group peptidase (beta-lactamase class C family)
VLPKTLAALAFYRDQGMHLGAQLFVSRAGEVIADLAFGEARPGMTMREDFLVPWLSAGKPLTAVAIAQLQEKGLVEWHDLVARHLPEFAQGNKGAVTIFHLLTHTGGFRSADKIDENLDWQETLRAICQTPLESDWAPGKKAGYHINASWFVLGEIVRRIDGRPIDQFVRDEICVPLGMMDSWLSLPPASAARYGERLAEIFRTTHAMPAGTSANIMNERSAVRPGSGARGPCPELALFYEMLLNGGRSPRRTTAVLRPETVRALVSRQRVGMFDHTFLHRLDWGLGFILNSNCYGPLTVPYGYGPHASDDTFGHSGSQSSCAFADPKHELVVAWVCNGQPGERKHQQRARAINAAIYEDLGLAPQQNEGFEPTATDTAF